MLRPFLIILLGFLSLSGFSQESSIDKFLNDSLLIHASVSLCIAETETGNILDDINSDKSLMPASVLKLVTTAAAIELLGPDYTFKTVVGYTGTLNRRSGKLEGDIVLIGEGDPALGSKYFKDHYGDFISKWVDEIRKLGIRKIEGKVITDDSYYDFQPVPSKWLWEDIGNYYGAGAYGLSVFDNTYEIHFRTLADGSPAVINSIIPEEYKGELTNFVIASGSTDEGYVFTAPYNTYGWITGTIPAGQTDFVLKASITDPPLFLAKLLNEKLEAAGIIVSGDPSTVRMEKNYLHKEVIPVSVTVSPPLSDIIVVLNHESVNLFAEHLVKELGKRYKNQGSTTAGTEVITGFLRDSGIKTDGMFIEDGSGLSPLNAINTEELVRLLNFMKNHGRHFPEYYASLADAGKNGTLANFFKDPVFDSNLKAKSGSMTRVMNYAGYFTSKSGKRFTFSIFVNNYSGTQKYIITGIESILKETILNN